MSGYMSSILGRLHLSSTKPDGAAPTPPTEEELKKLKEKYTEAKQDHVFQYWDELADPEKAELFQQLQDIDPEHVNEISEKALNPPKEDEDKKAEVEPLPEDATASILNASAEDIAAWNEDGLKLIGDNKVGVVLMAGGQGTRLGSSAPKGCFNVGLPSEKSLFQMQAERICKVQEMAAKKTGKEEVVVPWYVMTSGPTRQATEEFFESNAYFGLKKENVLIFEQGTLPCLSNEGKILLEEKGKVCCARRADRNI
jgi:UDP-N-acetylglucosamine/UDP-N-acetylgalactosamine diphosphorylase